MQDDYNKTAITKMITAAALTYLDERGCKPIETEVLAASGWISDLAGVVCPTITELTLLKLINRKPGGRRKYAEWHKAARQAQQLLTVIVEVKTSMSDYKGDRKWKLQSPANLSYLAVPGLLPIDESELPASWGILRYYPQGLRLARPPAIVSVAMEWQRNLILQVAMRRDNATRYERIRQLQKAQRQTENDRINRQRFSEVTRAIISVLNSEYATVEDCLVAHRVKCPEYLMEKLNGLFGKGRPGENVIHS
jgi:hypothetical protein